MYRNEVAERIRELRLQKGLTQNALANKAGISPTYIYDLEKAKKSPTIESISNICWGLGITLEEFFKEKTEIECVDKLSSLSNEQKKLLNQFLSSL